MLVAKTVMVEDKVEELMTEIVLVFNELHAGKSLPLIGLGLLQKMSTIVDDIKAFPADYAESFSGTVNSIELAATQVAAALLGKS